MVSQAGVSLHLNHSWTQSGGFPQPGLPGYFFLFTRPGNSEQLSTKNTFNIFHTRPIDSQSYLRIRCVEWLARQVCHYTLTIAGHRVEGFHSQAGVSLHLNHGKPMGKISSEVLSVGFHHTFVNVISVPAIGHILTMSWNI